MAVGGGGGVGLVSSMDLCCQHWLLHNVKGAETGTKKREKQSETENDKDTAVCH